MSWLRRLLGGGTKGGRYDEGKEISMEAVPVSPAGAEENFSVAFHRLAADVRSLAQNAFSSPGPLFDEQRKMILQKWFANFVKNLEAAAKAIEEGRDMAGKPISPDELAESLKLMCNEFGKTPVLGRLEEVCGQKVRSEIEKILSNIRDLAAKVAYADQATQSAPSRSAPTVVMTTCLECGKNFPWSKGDPKPPTGPQLALCANEGLPLERMKQITCPHCGTVSLVPEPGLSE